MKILLDTQIIIWLQFDRSKLPLFERQVPEMRDTHVHVSAVSFWEMRLKWASVHRSGERRLAIDPQLSLAHAAQMGWTILALEATQATTIPEQPMDHRDPFDEMLPIQAQQAGLELLTRDAVLSTHRLAVH